MVNAPRDVRLGSLVVDGTQPPSYWGLGLCIDLKNACSAPINSQLGHGNGACHPCRLGASARVKPGHPADGRDGSIVPIVAVFAVAGSNRHRLTLAWMKDPPKSYGGSRHAVQTRRVASTLPHVRPTTCERTRRRCPRMILPRCLVPLMCIVQHGV